MAPSTRSSVAKAEASSSPSHRTAALDSSPLRPARSSTRNAVPNSSDDDEDSDEDTPLALEKSRSGYQVLDAVVVPSRQPKREIADSDGSASVFSAASGSSDDVRDFETPATGKSMTPNGFSSNKGKGKATATATTNPLQASAVVGNKRKRASGLSTMETVEDAQVRADEEFARRLQEAEYEALASGDEFKSRTSMNEHESVPDAVAGSSKRPRLDEPERSATGGFGADEETASAADANAIAGSSKRPRLDEPKRRAADRFVADSETTSAADARSAVPTKGDASETDLDHDSYQDDTDYFGMSTVDDTEDPEFWLSDFEDEPPLRERVSTTVTALRQQRLAAVRARIAAGRAQIAALRRKNSDHFRFPVSTPKDRKRKKLEKAHPEILTMWSDLAKIPIITPVQAPQPASINRKLKSFQLEGLDWMIRQEKTQYKGGLLGDEMGMGKTIQAVSLIMSDYPAKCPTLVVVPPVALMQWQNEIREYTDGKLNVLVYHGSNAKSKNLTVREYKKFDVVLISYNSLESLFRKQTKGWSRKDEIVKECSPMHEIRWHRLILDEAHSIKQRTTGVAKACFALKGSYKWCLSGTPVQNRIGEFFSLLRFLEIRPFADYFCSKCPCAQLHWSLNAMYMCDHCGHSGSEHRSIFNEELLNPITGNDPVKRQEAMNRLHLITARVMLRRLKRDHTSSMELPPKEVIIHNEFFGEIERDFSTSIMTNTARTFDTYVSRGVMLNNYANIFGLIMQMRQVANHPDLLLKKHAEGGQNVLVCNICDEPAEEAIKSRCHHEFCRSCVKNYVQSSEGAGTEADCPRCHIPLSIDWEQPDIEQDEEQVKKSSIINRIKMEKWTSSSKIEMLVYDLYKLRSRKETLKSIVFSQFTSMLQLIEWRLRRAGFNTVMLDGSMTPVQRQRSIDYFMKNTDVEVFLVSLKAGGVALNLTEASRVFIVDPWWNPAAEWQSADRCHRIGQKRPCVITRLCIEDSVESRMVLLQEKKASMIQASINNDKVALEKLSPEDLQFLFRGT